MNCAMCIEVGTRDINLFPCFLYITEKFTPFAHLCITAMKLLRKEVSLFVFGFGCHKIKIVVFFLCL